MSAPEPSKSSSPPPDTAQQPSLSGLYNNGDHRPASIRHISEPHLQSPLRHHFKRPVQPKRQVKETLNARSEYSNSEDDGTAEHRINQYLIKQEIGRGSFGSVHLAVDQFGREFAVKEFSKSRLRKRAQSNFLKQAKAAAGNRRLIGEHHHAGKSFNSPIPRPSMDMSNSLELIREEIAIMKKLDHPNVVSLIEVLDDPTEDSLYVVMEMCKKGVVMKVGLDQRADPYSVEKTRHWFRDMVLGLEYLHAQGILHRDIKPDNCLVTDNDVLKIVDFGVSEMFSKDDTEMITKKAAGSPAFMPPELCTVKHGEVSGRAVDIWSMGVTLYCLAFGRIPFEKTVIVDLYESIKHDELQIPDECDAQLKDLLRRLLEKDPNNRIEMDDIRVHPWVTLNGKDDLLSKEDNTAILIEPPTDEEVNAAITAPMRRMVTVMKAAKKFKGLIAHKRPGFLQGMFGHGQIVQPPALLEHHVGRTHSDSIHNRHPYEGALAREGIHHDINFNDDLTRTQHFRKLDGEKEQIHITQHSPWPSAREKEKEKKAQQSQPQTQKSTKPQSHASTAAKMATEHILDTLSPSRPDTGKGHAHDPLEDLLFLSIGSSSDSPEQQPGDTPVVSESPGVIDINVYEKAYEEEIQRILDAKQKGHRPTLYLTKRVEGTKHLREHKDITDFSRVASVAGATLGLTKLAEAAKDHIETERRRAKEAVGSLKGHERHGEESGEETERSTGDDGGGK